MGTIFNYFVCTRHRIEPAEVRQTLLRDKYVSFVIGVIQMCHKWDNRADCAVFCR